MRDISNMIIFSFVFMLNLSVLNSQCIIESNFSEFEENSILPDPGFTTFSKEYGFVEPAIVSTECSTISGNALTLFCGSNLGQGAGVRVTTYFGFNPEATFLPTKQYTLELSYGLWSGNFNDEITLRLRASSSGQSGNDCSGTCTVIEDIPLVLTEGTSCNSILANFSPSQEYENLVISAFASSFEGDPPTIIIDNFCLSEVNSCEAAFEPISVEECGLVCFENTSSGEFESYSWTINGELVFFDSQDCYQFEETGNYEVCLTINDEGCEDATCQTIEVIIDKTDPIISCSGIGPFSGTGPDCDVELEIEDPVIEFLPACEDGDFVGFIYVRSDSLDISDPYPIGTTTITWTFIDGNGNSGSCSQDVIVVDEGCSYGTIEGIKFSDDNCDGFRDEDELGLSDWFIELIDVTTGISQFALTNSLGEYSFTDLLPGLYIIREINQPDWIQSAPNSSFKYVFVTVGNTEVIDFGNCPNSYCGMSVATCYGNPNVNAPVGVIFDTRYNSQAPYGGDWNDPPSGFSQIPSVHPAGWTANNIGEVYGIAIDDQDNIYLAASDIYNYQYGNRPTAFGPAGSGGIYKCSPPTYAPIAFTTLPNTAATIPSRANGLGNIVFDKTNNQLFASNLEDGSIYRIDINTGNSITPKFDPFTLDDNVDGIVTQSEQIWGLGINVEGGVTKLYFARSRASAITYNEIWSIELQADGSFDTSTVTLEIAQVPGDQRIVADIAFSSEGRMLLGEIGNPHSAEVNEFIQTSGAWSLNKHFFVGGSPGKNSAGGVDYGNSELNGDIRDGCDSLIWATGNYMMTDLGGLIYGMQGIKASGNILSSSSTTDIFVDFVTGGNDKGGIGDVELFKCGCLDPVDFPCDSVMVMVDTLDYNPTCIDSSLIDPDVICTFEYDPVCGCNGETYSNVCEAGKQGIKSWTLGECTGEEPEDSTGCWYELDIIEKGFELGEIEVEVITPGVIFNSAQLNENYTFSNPPVGNTIRLLPIPSDTIIEDSKGFQFCLGGIEDESQFPQCVVVKYYVPGENPDEQILACEDTLKFYCPMALGDSCLYIKEETIECIPESPDRYCYSFKVQNLSNQEAKQMVINSLDPDIKFISCNPLPFETPQPIWAINFPNCLASGECSEEVSVGIVTCKPIQEPTEFCFEIGLFNDGACCSSPYEHCVTIEPCCNPCEDKSITVHPLTFDEVEVDGCCYSIDISNECDINFFTKVGLTVNTGGVIISSHFTDGPTPGNWSNPKSNTTCIEWEHDSGHIPQGTTPNLINFCLGDIDPGEVPQNVVLSWIAADVNGQDSIACSDDIILECVPPIDTTCISVIDIVPKGNLCDTINCWEEPYCLDWLRDEMTAANATNCSGLHLETVSQALYNGEVVYLLSSNSVPDAGYDKIFNCTGELLQICSNWIGGVMCEPDTSVINIFSVLTSINPIWTCGDPIPPKSTMCSTTDDFLSFCLTIKNNSYPAHNATEVIILPLDPLVNIYPPILPLPNSGLGFCDTATLDIVVYGDINPGDTVKYLMRLHDSDSDDDWCCFNSDTLCIIIPPCDTITECCDMTESFCESFDDVINSIEVDGCTVCFDDSLIDTCSVGIQVVWSVDHTENYLIDDLICNTYDSSGTYTICLLSEIYPDESQGNEPCITKDTCIDITLICSQLSCDSLPIPEIITPDICIAKEVEEGDVSFCQPGDCTGIIPGSGTGIGNGMGDEQGEICIPTCDSSKVTYYAVQHIGSSYEWHSIGGIIQGSNNLDSVCVEWFRVDPSKLILIETTAEGCIDSTEVCIEFLDSPNANFDYLPNPSCANVPIYFTNLSTDYTDWLWDFGDGTISTLLNPDHKYTNPGTYTVTLTVSNTTTLTFPSPNNIKCQCMATCVCSDTISMDIVIGLEGPPIYCVSTVCAGDTACYYSDELCPGGIYNWIVDSHGTIVSGGSPTDNEICVVWNNGEIGELSLQVPNCPNYCPFPTIAKVPIIDPNVLNIEGPTLVCNGDIEGYNVSKFGASIYDWQVVNGTILSPQPYSNFINILWNDFSSMGQVIVTVTHYDQHLDNQCSTTDTLDVALRRPFEIVGLPLVCENEETVHSVNYQGPSSGGFIWTTTGGTITSSNGGNNITIKWDTGPGTYTLTAVPNTPSDFCNDIFNYEVKVSPLPVDPILVDGPLVICPNNTYTYTADAIPLEGEILWSATNGTVQPISGTECLITWDNSGSGYGISLVHKSNKNPYCISDTTVILIDVIQGLTIIGPNQVCPNLTSSYKAIVIPSSIPGEEIEWTFTNQRGSILSGQGSDSVYVQWSNDPGVTTLTASICGVSASINVTITPPVVPTISAPPNICSGSTDVISVTGTYTSLNMSNATLLTGSPNPTFQINGPGKFVFTGLDVGGCPVKDSVTVDPIEINDVIFALSPVSYCIGANPGTVNISLKAPAGYTYQWQRDCGGGYSNVGTSQTYIESNVSTDCKYRCEITLNGCSEFSNVIDIFGVDCSDPGTGTGGNDTPCPTTATADFTRDTCDFTKNFDASLSTNGVSYFWDFGDTNTGSGILVSHTYSAIGNYDVRLWVTDASGCSVVIVKQVSVPFVPDFDWNFANCNNGSPMDPTFQFTDLSEVIDGYTITNYFWEIFNECTGTIITSNLQNPLIEICSTCGLPSSVKLTVTVSNGFINCTGTVEKLIDPAGSTADAIIPIEACVGQKIDLIDNSCGAAGWLWDYDDGFTSALGSHSKTYEATGTYNISLVVTDNYGCESAPFTRQIVIHDDPVVAITTNPSPAEICSGDTAILTATPGFVDYKWLYSEDLSILPGSNNQNTYSAFHTGLYTVEVTDNNGCTSRADAIELIVHQFPDITIEGDVELCEGDDLMLSVAPGYTAYAWSITSLSNTSTWNSFEIPNMTVGNYTVTVSVTDNSPLPCTKDFMIDIVVHPNPDVPIIIANPTYPSCEGDLIMLSISNVMPGIIYGWSTGEYGTSIVLDPALVGKVKVTATDLLTGCQSESIPFEVHPLPDVCFFPTGCWEVCETDTICIPDFYSGYQWLKDGVPISSASDSCLIITESGQYQLILETPYGCIDTTGIAEVTVVNCFCDMTSINYSKDTTVMDSCCWTISIDNQYKADFFKGIEMNLAVGGNLSYLDALNGWEIDQFNSSTGVVKPPGGSQIPIGNSTIATLCVDNASHIEVDLNWLTGIFPDSCVVACTEKMIFDCPIVIDPDTTCILVVQDSIDCENEKYCFKVTNNSSPGFVINYLHLTNIVPGSAALNPNPISIPDLQVGETSDWICVDYPGIAFTDSLCFNITGHFDDNGTITTCCTDTITHCVLIDCPQDFTCDSLSINILETPDPDDCCYNLSVTNNWQDSLFKGILVEVNSSTLINNVSAMNGWNVASFNNTSVEIHPPSGSGFIDIGTHNDIVRICSDDPQANSHLITISWLMVLPGGGCDTICPTDVDVQSCPHDRCVIVVQDSIDCENEIYCFKVTNNSFPPFTINYLELTNLLPSTAILTPNPISIPDLASGMTSDWICVNYPGMILTDSLCFNIAGHFENMNGDLLTCCTDTTVHCVEIDCNPPPLDCDSLAVNIQKDNAIDSCCYLVSVTNNYLDNYFKGVKFEIQSPAILSNINALNGWVISGFNGQFIELTPPNNFVSLGTHTDIVRICNEGFSTNPHNVEFSWLVDVNGNCEEVCPDTLSFACGIENDFCINLIDTFDCVTNEYCIKITNTTSPQFEIGSIALINPNPSGAMFTPNPISIIPPIQFGETSDWLCVDVSGVSIDDVFCYNVVVHKEDISTEPLPTWCCSDTILHCAVLPNCNPCDSLSVDVTSIAVGDSCCFSVDIYNGHLADHYIGIKAEVITSGIYFANIQSNAPDWDLINANASEYVFHFDDGINNGIPIGNFNIGSYCLTGINTSPQTVQFSWLEINTNGDTIATCISEEVTMCDPVPDDRPCAAILDDSIYCDADGKHFIEFKIQNNTHLLGGGGNGYDFLSYNIALFTSNGSGILNPIVGSLSSNTPFPLPPGQVTDQRVAHEIIGGFPGDTICFGITGHDQDLPQNYLNCCTTDTTWCFVIPSCDPIIGGNPCDSIWISESSSDIDSCCFVYDIHNEGSLNQYNQIQISSSVAGIEIVGIDQQNWTVTNNANGQSSTWIHSSGVIPSGVIMDEISFCMIGIDDPAQVPYLLEVEFYVSNAGIDSLACLDTIMVDCNITGKPPCDLSQIIIPNGISPDNGDNLNQTLDIIHPSECGAIDIAIYNRWGQRVWSKRDYDNSWDGRSFNGEQLPDGTYFLILTFDVDDLEGEIFSTYIDLRRE